MSIIGSICVVSPKGDLRNAKQQILSNTGGISIHVYIKNHIRIHLNMDIRRLPQSIRVASITLAIEQSEQGTPMSPALSPVLSPGLDTRGNYPALPCVAPFVWRPPTFPDVLSLHLRVIIWFDRTRISIRRFARSLYFKRQGGEFLPASRIE